MKYAKHLLTQSDNETYSLSKLLAFGAGCAMVYEFVAQSSTAFQDFGVGVGAMVAALAAKQFVEQKDAS